MIFNQSKAFFQHYQLEAANQKNINIIFNTIYMTTGTSVLLLHLNVTWMSQTINNNSIKPNLQYCNFNTEICFVFRATIGNTSCYQINGYQRKVYNSK